MPGEGPPDGPRPAELRLAELLGPLSLVTDMGMGSPDETAMRNCLLATALARKMNLPEATVADVYYTSLLKHLGCTATAHDEALRFGGNELESRQIISPADFERPREMLSVLGHIGAGSGPLRRVRTIVSAATSQRFGEAVQQAICEVAAMTANRLGLPQGVEDSLSVIYARWDGKGVPAVAGEDIPLPARFAQVAERAIAFHHAGGVDAAVAAVSASSGGWFDPAIAECFAEHGPGILRELDEVDALEALLAAEPEPVMSIPAQRLDGMARTFADMVDLKMPFTVGHSSGVARLVTQAGERLGFSAQECLAVRHAAHLHDLGRAGVSAGIWAKRSALSAAERERVQLHAYYSERILARTPALSGVATIAGMHHERLNGSGYHRAAQARDIPMPARLLAAADAYQTMLEERPHRAAMPPDAASGRLLALAGEGAIDADAAQAVLSAAGQPVQAVNRTLPAGLTGRELEVLRLMARGFSNREIAEELVISRRTAEHHVQHIYDKIGVSTRAAASMFAVRHDLVAAHQPG